MRSTLLAVLLAVSPARAADPLPPDLDLIPRDAGAFVTVRVADLWQSDLSRPLRAAFGKDGRALAELEKSTGLRPEHVERLTLVMPSLGPDAGPPLVVVATAKPYDRQRLLRGLAAVTQRHEGDAVPKEIPDAPFYRLGDRRGSAIVPIDAKTFVYLELGERPDAAADLVARLLRGRAPGGLSDGLAAAAGTHHVVAGLNPSAVAENFSRGVPLSLTPLLPLLRSKGLTATLDLGDVSKLGVELRFADAAEAAKGARTVEAVRTLLGEIMPAFRARLGPDGDDLRKFLDGADAVVGGAAVEVKGTAVRVRADVKVDLALAAVIVAAAERVGEAARRQEAINHFKIVGLAMHNYESAYGYFPSSDGPEPPNTHPVSWRVRVLPFIEQDNLYRMYRFDQPWDSENNKKLIPMMPKTYEIPGHPAKEKGHTFIRVFTGRSAMFGAGRKTSFAQIPDGTSNTIMAVDAAESVPWTKPEDLPYDESRPVPKLGGHFRGGFIALLGDGSVRFVKDTTAEQTLRAMITANGGEVIQFD